MSDTDIIQILKQKPLSSSCKNEENKINTCIDKILKQSSKLPLSSDEDNDLYCDEKFSLLPPPYHCIVCYEYMGDTNSRQYCCKIHCPFNTFNENDLLITTVYHLRVSPCYNDPAYMLYSEYHDTIEDYIKLNQNK